MQQDRKGQLGQPTIYDSQTITVMGTEAYIHIRNRKGAVVGKAVIDAQDVELVSRYKWHFDSKGYIRANPGVKLHRLVMNAPPGLQVDHINHSKTDNRKCNLRVCSNFLNSTNRSFPNNTGYRGVYEDRRRKTKRFVARLGYKGATHQIGSFDTAEEAHIAYKSYLVTLGVE